VPGALVLSGLPEAQSFYGAWYLVIVGALAVIATLATPLRAAGIRRRPVRLSLLPVGCRVRPPRG
jgi:hypothetical protein